MYHYDRHSRTNINLISFLRSICGSNVHLIKRGDPISDNFVALWPDKNNLRRTIISSEVMNTIPPHTNELLVDISSRLFEAVNLMQSAQYSTLSIPDIERLLQQCEIDIRDLQNSDIHRNEEDEIKLGKLGNNVSIVFRNKRNFRGRNMLFTGDIGGSKLRQLQRRTDYPRLLGNYHIIKVPHHGTNKTYHYFNFKRIARYHSYFLIPNGSVTGRNGNKWGILDEYIVSA